MGRAPCCEKVGLKKGPWTPEEDQKLVDYVNLHGHGSWRSLPKKAGLLRCGKSCRLRWTNYLRPGIKRGKFSLSEEQLIIQLHALLGNRWSAIASHLPKRTDNEIKNYWNTHLKKRLVQMGVDPATHKPFGGFGALAAKPVSSIVDVPSGSLSHHEQWENVRLEAEARLAARATFLDTTDALNWQKSLQGQAAAMLWPNKLPNILDITASNSDISGSSSAQSSCSNILLPKPLLKTTQHHLKPPSQESTVTSMNTTSLFENTIGSDDSYTINSDHDLLAGTSSFDIGEEEFIRSFMEEDASDEWTSLLGQLTESQSQSQSQGQEDLLF